MNSYPSRIMQFALAVVIAIQPLLLPLFSSADSSLASTAAAAALEADASVQTNDESWEDFGLESPVYEPSDDYEPAQIAPPDTPVWVNLSLSKRLISASETTQLSINVVPVFSLTPAPVHLQLELPEGLEVVNDEREWKLPALADGDEHDWTVTIGVSKTGLESLPGAYEIAVRASAAEHRDEVASLIMGVVADESGDDSASRQRESQAVVTSNQGTVLMDRKADGRVNMAVLATEKSASSGVALEQELLYEWRPQPSASASITESIALDTNAGLESKAFLPWVAADGESTISAEMASEPPMEGGVRVYRKWSLNAVHDTEKVEKFESPLLMIVDAKDIVEAGIDPKQLLIWTRANAEYSWSEVRTEYVEEEQIWIAHLTHFSDYALGQGITAGYYAIPSMQSTHADLYSGSASYSIPLRAPDGVGGMNPNLSLSYSSGTVDNVLINTKDLRMSQASVVGYGWDIGGLNYIARIDPDNEGRADYFTLVIDGQRVDITGAGTAWGMTPHLFAHIQHDAANSPQLWVISMPNGYRYTYGGIMQGSSWAPTLSYRDENVSRRLDRENSTIVRLIDKWMLAKVEDPQGNTITYHYEAERNATQPQCDGHTSNANYQWFTGAVHLTSVTWSGNSSQSLEEKLRMTFTYSSRSDTSLDASQAWCRQVRISQRRLNEVKVQAKVGSSWHTIRSYALSGTYNPGNVGLQHLLLQTVTEKGKNGSALVAQTFTYQDYKNHDNQPSRNNIRLKTAANGYGGSIEYRYKKHDFNLTHPNIGDRTGEPYPVTNTWIYDGYSGWIEHMYEYGNNRAAEYNDVFEWLGFDVATEGVFTKTANKVAFNPSNPRTDYIWYSETWFHTGSTSTEDHRKGKPYKTTVFNQRTSITSGLKQYARTEYTWEAVSKTLGSAKKYWIRLRNKNEWSTGAGLLKEYHYQESSQQIKDQSGNYVNAQYGNVTKVEEKGTADAIQTLSEWTASVNNSSGCEPLLTLRTTETEFFPNAYEPSNKYLTDLPARVRVYDGTATSANCVSETRYVYAKFWFGNQNRSGAYKDHPTTNLVVREQQAINGCSTSINPDRYSQGWLETSAVYDRYGNPEWVKTMGNDSSDDEIVEYTYDSTYHMFPISQRHDQDNDYTITARYYGVNGPSEVPISSINTSWGAMAEHCGIDNLCSRQKYDEFGRPRRRWDKIPEGTAWTGSYDMLWEKADMLWKYYMPGFSPSSRTTYTVTEHGKPRYEGNFVRKHYNGLGQLVAETSPDEFWEEPLEGYGTASSGGEIHVHYAYDAMGNRTHQSAALDELRGQADRIHEPDWTTVAHTRIKYDPLGRAVFEWAPNGEQTSIGYDGRTSYITALGCSGNERRRLRYQVTDALGHPTAIRTKYWNGSSMTTLASVLFDYDVLGNLTKIDHADDSGGTPATGNTTYEYDAVGRMTQMNDPDMGVWQYEYDRKSRLTKQTDACLNETKLTYDSMGRLSKKEFDVHYTDPCSTQDRTYDVDYSYIDDHSVNGMGNLSSITYSDGSYKKEFTYTLRGLPDLEKVSFGSTTYTTKFYYNHWVEQHRIKYPDGEMVTTSFNGMGLPQTLAAGDDNLVDSVLYDARGAVERMEFPEVGLWRRQEYHWGAGNGNGNGRLAAIKLGTIDGGGDKLHLQYRYDVFGNTTHMIQSFSGANPNTHYYYYDHQNRLTSAYNFSYSWHKSGRIDEFSGDTYGYSASHPHAVTHVNGSSNPVYAYNANGSMTTRYNNGNPQTLEWNVENRLASINGGNTYMYDPDGQRVKKTENGITTYYINRYYEKDSNGNKTKYYFFGDQRIAMRKGGVLSILNTDHLGSIVMETPKPSDPNNPPTPGWRRYLAFGRERGSSSPALTTAYQFTGQEQDSTGLLYYKARYYDPKLGTFISPDPVIPDPTKVFAYNRYMYAYGNPVKFNDPSGYAACVDRECHVLQHPVTERYFAGQTSPGIKQIAQTVVNELGGVDDLGAMAMIVEVGAGLYRDWDDFMAAMGEVFIGTSTYGAGALLSAAGAGGCGGVGREAFDCLGNTAFFADSGFDKDFRDGYNQPYHVWGYIAQSVALPGGNTSLTANLLIGHAGNIIHDVVQGKLRYPNQGRGASWQDYVLSLAGMEIGVIISDGTIASPSELSGVLIERLGPTGPGSNGWLKYFYNTFGPLGENLQP